MKKNFYLIANFARSFDKFHIHNNTNHLVSSIFYTEDLKADNLKNLTLDKDKILNVIYIDNLDINHLNIYKTQDNINIFLIPNIYLMKEFLNSNDKNNINQTLLNTLRDKNMFKEIIELLLDDYNQLDKIKNINLNQYIFIFKNLNWFTLQLIFKNWNITLSGGTLNKRHIVSTTQFNLIKFLISLDFKDKDFFNSFKYGTKNYESIKEISFKGESLILHMDKNLILKIIKDKNKLLLSKITENLNIINKDIKAKNENVLNLEQEKLEFKNKKIKLNKNLKDSKKLIKLEKRIEELNNRIKSLNLKVLDLENKQKKILTREEQIYNLNYDTLRELYIREFLNDRSVDITNKIKDSGITSKKKNREICFKK